MEVSFGQPMLKAKLIRRYKRFLVDVELEDGSVMTAYCPNTGAMTGCAEGGWNVWLSKSHSSTRKYPYTWELVETDKGLVCIHSVLANKIVAAALNQNAVTELQDYSEIRAEVPYGGEGSRVDFLLSGKGKCYVEVKSVTLLRSGGLGAFPDAVSSRGAKHLRELMTVKAEGHRAVVFCFLLNTGRFRMTVADDIDKIYGDTLRQALRAGVEILAYGCEITHKGMGLSQPMEFH
jgi:sugar fermentation stimulation protein A